MKGHSANKLDSKVAMTELVVPRLLEIARQQKLRVNSNMSQRDLLDSGIDILETNAELCSERKQLASRHDVDAQLYAAGITLPQLHCLLQV